MPTADQLSLNRLQLTGKNIYSVNLRDVQIQDDEIRLEFTVFEYLNYLLSIPRYGDFNEQVHFCDNLPYEEDITGVVLHQISFGAC